MKPTQTLTAVSLALAVVFTSATLAADPAKPTAAEPNADQLLRQLSAKLTASKSFTFQATREIDAALLEGHNLPEKARISVTAQRPNKLSARSESKAGERRFVADGRTLSLLDGKPNHYATVPMRTTIDGLVDQLEQKYGFVPPLAEFALSNPYAEFKRQAHTISYLGRGKTTEGFLGLAGVECHRLALKGKVADAELWIGVGDQLPRKLVATFHRAGQPQLRIAFSTWNLAAPVNAADFTFHPPQGAQKIEMWTTAKMNAARKR